MPKLAGFGHVHLDQPVDDMASRTEVTGVNDDFPF